MKAYKLIHLLALLPLAALPLLAAGLGRATAQPADITGTPSFLPLVQNNAGIQTLYFYMFKTAGVVYENMFFSFGVVNNTANVITYGILAAHTDQGVTADSWNAPLQPGQVLYWTDHINFPNPGIYQVYLGICYSSHEACKTGGAPWARLSDNVTVVIFPAGITGTPSFLPLIVKAAATPTLAPTATPVTSNLQCQTYGPTQICAMVLNGYPPQNSTETVYGRLIISGVPQAGQIMSTTWHYQTATSSCGGTTDVGGLAWCSQFIGQATSGYQVNVDVSINGYSATTWFTPR
jgi:hypothetical protein